MADIPKNAKKVFSGEIFDIYQWEQEMFDGSKKIFEAAKRASTVQVIAITSEGKLLINEEEQPYVGKFLSVPGGVVDEGEDPQDSALRELIEETGYKGEKVELWRVEGSGSKLKWDTYYYIIKNCRKVSEKELDAGEKVNVMEVSLEKFLELADDSSFRNRTFSDILFRIKKTPEKWREFLEKLELK